MLGIACLGAWSGIADVEIGDMPVFDEAAELGHHPEFLELPEPFDRQYAGIIKHVLLTIGLYPLLTVCCFVRDCGAASAREVDEVPGLAIQAAAVLEDFAMDHRAPRVLCDLELVRSEPTAALAKFHSDGDRSGSVRD